MARLEVEEDQPDRDWTTPGAFRVADGVYRLPLPLPGDGLRAVNVYALADTSGLVLVDGGWAIRSSETALADALAPLNFELSGIQRFLVTHAHRDHYSQAVAIRQRFGTPVAIGIGERVSLVPVIADPAGYGQTRQARLLACGAHSLAARLTAADEDSGDNEPSWELPDHWLRNLDRISVGERSLHCVETPGHTRGHVVFHDEEGGILFGGDHLLPHITPSIGFERIPSPSPLSEYLTSLQLTLKLADARLLPAHGPVSESSHARAIELLEHHDQRLEATLKAVEDGAETAYETARTLKWTRRQSALDMLDDFNQLLAVLETDAHLSVLVERGVISCSVADGVVRYFELRGGS